MLEKDDGQQQKTTGGAEAGSAQGVRSVESARRLVDRLLGIGTTEAVLAPGSRSGPLALAMHAADAQGLLRLHVRVDEREAGFLALGLAKASRLPVPVITTSGTAVANVHPAMLEAHHAGVPVIAVTADRPARLRGTGANQTTDQRHLFGGVTYFETIDALRGGPAQLNLELDEPLVEPQQWIFEPDQAPDHAPPPTQPLTLAPGPLTVVVAGDDAGPRARIVAREGGWPLLAEPSSGARTGGALPTYRLLLDSPLAERVERVISFGHPTLSRPVSRLLSRADVDVLHVGGPSTFPAVPGPRVTFVDDVVVEADAGERSGWLDLWRDADERVAESVGEVIADLGAAAPLNVAQAVHEAVGPGGLLFVGSSQPIRDLDLVAAPYPVGERRLVLANRGLAGIDGTVSSAVGAALTRQRRYPGSSALAVMGDLTFLHGANGLLIGPHEPVPDLRIVVVNDDGGSIFSTLEQGAPVYADAFERIFATPTGTDVSALCRAHGIGHRRVEVADLATALAGPVKGLEIVEVAVPRSDRRSLHEAVGEAAARHHEALRRAVDEMRYRE